MTSLKINIGTRKEKNSKIINRPGKSINQRFFDKNKYNSETTEATYLMAQERYT